MRQLLEIQRQLVPELLVEMKKRHTILQRILISGVIGRRSLAVSLDMTERVLRSEAEFLKSQGLVEFEANGIRITEAGKQLLERMEPIMKEAFGLTGLEEQIRSAFGLKHVVIVPGNADESPYTKSELGLAGAAVLRKSLRSEDIIAVTGGSTMASIATHLNSSSPLKDVWFVPARGGLGERVELQANTIASKMAQETGGHYRLLHVPDDLGEEAYQSLIQEPNVREIIDFVRKCRIVIHGIGDAMIMARRRKVDEPTIAQLQQAGALAEAFGYYFDEDGKVVNKMLTLGLQLDDIMGTELVIGVAGGRSKGKAIAAVLKFGHEDILVTDEAAALEIAAQL